MAVSTQTVDSPQQGRKSIVVSDFDGTIVDIDTGEYLLSRFATGDWRTYDERLERGEISLEECLRRQFAMIREREQDLIQAVDGAASFRAGFADLVGHCRKKRVPFVVLSAGLDFVIRHMLSNEKLQDQVVVVAPRARATKRGITFDFTNTPRRGRDFKSELVRAYRAEGRRAVYVGDGFSDFGAAKNADVRFAIRGSRLAELCRKEGVASQEISDLAEVIPSLDE